MTTRRGVAAVLIGLTLVAAVPGCSKTAGTPIAAPETSTAKTAVTSGSASATSSALSPATAPAAPTPTGPPVGSAVVKVIGGSAPVTIRYQINGGAEQTETGVTLPWQKEYPVYDELETSVTADGGDAELTCTITMDGDKLVAFKTEKRPTCNFSYWG